MNADEERGRVKGHYDCAARVEEERISLSLQIANRYRNLINSPIESYSCFYYRLHRMPPYKNSSTFVNSGSEKMVSFAYT